MRYSVPEVTSRQALKSVKSLERFVHSLTVSTFVTDNKHAVLTIAAGRSLAAFAVDEGRTVP